MGSNALLHPGSQYTTHIMGVRVFLDVDIGDRAAWEQARQEYDLAKKFFEASAPTVACEQS